ncbi:MAG: preprotein translocase subunit YajC [Firmicutes bacterium]|nr:preprotein translocase subunit YajC [Bacillota bacterium]
MTQLQQSLIYLGIFMLVFWFFIIKPRKQQEKKHKDIVESIKRGDKVVTIGGLKGEVSRVKDDSVMIKVDESTELEYVKNAIAYKVEDK